MKNKKIKFWASLLTIAPISTFAVTVNNSTSSLKNNVLNTNNSSLLLEKNNVSKLLEKNNVSNWKEYEIDAIQIGAIEGKITFIELDNTNEIIVKSFSDDFLSNDLDFTQPGLKSGHVIIDGIEKTIVGFANSCCWQCSHDAIKGKVTLPSTTKNEYLDVIVFEDQKQIESIDFSLINTDNNIFELPIGFCNGCSLLKTIIFPHNLQKLDIGTAAFKSTKIESIVFEDSIEELTVGSMAFQNCSELKTVKLPINHSKNANVSVLHSTFKGCTKLRNINLQNIRFYGDSAFCGCSSLESLEFLWTHEAINNFDTQFGPNCFNGCDVKGEDFILPANTTFVGDSAFCGNIYTGNLYIPSKLKLEQAEITNIFSKRIEWLSFKTDANGLIYSKEKTVDGLKYQKIFYGFGNIEQSKKYVKDEFVIEDDTTFIATAALDYLESQNTKVILPDSIQQIGKQLPVNLYSENNVIYGYDKNNKNKVAVISSMPNCDPKSREHEIIDFQLKGIKIIADGAFQYIKLVDQVWDADSLIYIGSSAFINQNAVFGKLSLDSLCKIGVEAFENSTFNEIYLGHAKQLKEITDFAFSGCKKLTKMVLPESLEQIHSGAFKSCSGLTGDLIIPQNVKWIWSSAFEDCFNLNGNLYFKSNDWFSIGTWAFKNTNFKNIYISMDPNNVSEKSFWPSERWLSNNDTYGDEGFRVHVKANFIKAIRDSGIISVERIENFLSGFGWAQIIEDIK